MNLMREILTRETEFAVIDLGGVIWNLAVASDMLALMPSSYLALREHLRFYVPRVTCRDWEAILWGRWDSTYLMDTQSDRPTCYGIPLIPIDSLYDRNEDRGIAVLTLETNWPELSEPSCAVLATNLRGQGPR